MVDQISHGLSKKIRRVADEMAVSLLFSWRSIASSAMRWRWLGVITQDK